MTSHDEMDYGFATDCEERAILKIDQMKVGGRLVVPIGSCFQKLKVITKLGDGKTVEENIISVRFVPMVHTEETPHNSSKYSINK